MREGTCSYQVTDEDNETFETQIQFAQIAGYRVPARIVVNGALDGVLALRESKARFGQCKPAAVAPLDYLCGR